MAELRGWLLDLYAGSPAGVVLWLLGEDGRRYRLLQDFPVTFYAAGPAERLRQLWRYLKAHTPAARLSRTERRDLFQTEPVTVLAVETDQPGEQPRLFAQVSRAFPELTFYDTDLPLSLRHAARYATFPLAHCRVTLGTAGRVTGLQVLDTPWDTDPPGPPLRILSIEPDTDPRHAPPQALHLRLDQHACRLPLEPARPLLTTLSGILRQYDPDLLLTAWGDGWMLPQLLRLSEQWRIPLPLNRDSECGIDYHQEHTYFSYGQVIYRDQQIHLFGRCHIDAHNAMLFHDYGLEGVYELSRVTSLPLQSAARVSPGSGISAMEMITALRQDILVPWHKQQAEQLKSAWQLIQADQGGLVYQPTTGLHHNVAELDFVSMYPSIMVHGNISPETVTPDDLFPTGKPEGLVPQTLKPLLEKRLALKRRLATLPAGDARRTRYQARVSAHKWLLVTCFGYLGYKNARFGRIEAHEAVTAYGRDALLSAKEAAEDLGYTVLHLYVDGLWVYQAGRPLDPAGLEELLAEIRRRTGLPIALDGIYRWLAFLPSKTNETVPVANRYFGVFTGGSLKTRGIEARRRDTPPWVAEAQMELLEAMSQTVDPAAATGLLPWAVDRLRSRLSTLRQGRVPLEKLVVAQKLSRDIDAYTSPSPAARAAAQLLQETGRFTRPGQIVRFVYTLGRPGVHAWDLPHPPDPARIHLETYARLLLRAAATVLQPLGAGEADLRRSLRTPTALPASTVGRQYPLAWRSTLHLPAG
jgi:DNA polymerase-2